MIKVSELSGALLDYYVARAEGIPAERLEIRKVQRTDELICVQLICIGHHAGGMAWEPHCMNYGVSWEKCGQLMEKHKLTVAEEGGTWYAGLISYHEFCVGDEIANGPTPHIAICRSVVHKAFGNEVQEIQPC